MTAFAQPPITYVPDPNKADGAPVAASGGIPSGNYAGGQPNFTPASGAAVAIDTSNNRPWWYVNGQWN
jgi:hypothetical protein